MKLATVSFTLLVPDNWTAQDANLTNDTRYAWEDLFRTAQFPDIETLSIETFLSDTLKPDVAASLKKGGE